MLVFLTEEAYRRLHNNHTLNFFQKVVIKDRTSNRYDKAQAKGQVG